MVAKRRDRSIGVGHLVGNLNRITTNLIDGHRCTGLL